MLGHLPHEGLAVGLRHPVGGFHALVRGDQFVESGLPGGVVDCGSGGHQITSALISALILSDHANRSTNRPFV